MLIPNAYNLLVYHLHQTTEENKKVIANIIRAHIQDKSMYTVLKNNQNKVFYLYTFDCSEHYDAKSVPVYGGYIYNRSLGLESPVCSIEVGVYTVSSISRPRILYDNYVIHRGRELRKIFYSVERHYTPGEWSLVNENTVKED